jgi:hypothetical protein
VLQDAADDAELAAIKWYNRANEVISFLQFNRST